MTSTWRGRWRRGPRRNGVFGAKLMWGYLGDFAELLRGIEGMAARPLPELLARAFPGLRYIQITRENKIRQAVSLWKAVQTQAWKAGDEVQRPVELVFSFRAINYLVRLLTAHDASWDAYFLGLGYEPLKLTYEELAESTDAVIHRVLEHLGIPAPAGLVGAGAAVGPGRRGLRGLGATRGRAPARAGGTRAGVNAAALRSAALAQRLAVAG